MTISSDERIAGPFNGNGSQTVFPFAFKVFEKGDAAVVRADAAGAEHILVLDSDFSVALNVNQDANPGGSITYPVLGDPLPSGETLTITTDVPVLQLTDITNAGGFYPQVIEDALDRNVVLIQQIYGIARRALQLSISTPTGVDVTLPRPVAGNILGWDPLGEALANYAPETSISTDVLRTELASAIGAALVGFLQSGVGAVARTLEAKAQDRCCVFDFMTTAQVAAVRAGLGGANAIVADAIQRAMDSGFAEIFFPMGLYLLDKPLLVKPTSTQNLKLIGESLVATLIQPSAVDISTAPQNVNALIINQNNDGKFSLENLRFQSSLAYTGVGIYAVEGGCADGSGQCLFSGSIFRCWFSLATPNGGIFKGALQNYQVMRNVFENAKSCFILQGPGTIDVFFGDNHVFNSYDGFIEAKQDSINRRLIVVRGLNVYGHIRGAVIAARNAIGWDISGVNLLGNDIDVPVDMGLFDFEDSTGLRISSCGQESLAPYGLAKDAMIFKGSSGSISKIRVQGADRGIVINGTAPVDLTFTDVDLLDLVTSMLVTNAAASGRIVKNGGSWRGAQGSGIVNNAAAGNLSFTLSGGRLLNAGMGGAAGTRLMDMNTAGPIQMNGVDYGRDDNTAAAAYFFQGAGTGEWVVNGGRRIGSAPSADSIGTQPMKFSGVDGRAAVYFGSASPQKGVWNRGDAVRNDTPTVGQPKGWTCTVAGGANSATRANTTLYAINTWVLWTTGTTVWEVTTAGTSAGAAPSIVGKVVGDTVVDGTVTWTMRSLTAATFVSEGNL